MTILLLRSTAVGISSVCLLLLLLGSTQSTTGFQASPKIISSKPDIVLRATRFNRRVTVVTNAVDRDDASEFYQPDGVLDQETFRDDHYVLLEMKNNKKHPLVAPTTAAAVVASAAALVGTPENAVAAMATSILSPSSSSPSSLISAGDAVPSAAVAWLHFIGIIGVAGGLVTERCVIKKNMPVEDEILINNADGVYGLSALLLLISGYFRVTQYAKGWDFYKNEPIFWVKMSAVAVLGALSFFPAIIFFRRDQARGQGITLPPLSDPIIDRITTIINAELLAFLTIPLLATFMARGVGYVEGFPWAIGVLLYAVSLGGAGYKYGKEAFDMMEEEQSLVPITQSAVDEK